VEVLANAAEARVLDLQSKKLINMKIKGLRECGRLYFSDNHVGAFIQSSDALFSTC
tara:strand:+ start:820 stop:987 length:168 start_codon:yes stop_codon:yes gene_type:complete